MSDIEYRMRRYVIRDKDLISLLNWWHEMPAFIEKLPRIGKLPEDARIRALDYDYARMALCAIVISKEFDVVPEGEMVPVVYSDVYNYPVEPVYQRMDTIMGAGE